VSFLLDTDVCSAYLKGNNRLVHRFTQHAGHLHVSAITTGELLTWALMAGTSSNRYRSLVILLRDMTFLDINRDVAEKFADLRVKQFRAGRQTPDNDLFIAATAIVHDLVVVTHNQKHFTTIPGLAVQDWLVS
jgi:tRNA(fMet)-specific endonuclease VapC